MSLMWLLYAVGIPYVIYTLSRWRLPNGHGLNWKEPSAYNMPGFGGSSVYGGLRMDRHLRDLEWHPDEMLRGTVTNNLPDGEPQPVPL